MSSLEAASKIHAAAWAMRERRDPRALFAEVYSTTIQASYDRRHEFRNPRWVEALIVNYANLYRQTLLNELTGHRRRTPRAWQYEFNYIATSGRNGKWSAELDLIYGIHVHIARDLVEALFVTPTQFENESVRADYFHITQVLKDAMPRIWRVYLTYSYTLHLFPQFTQRVIKSWIAWLRLKAWNDARMKARLNPSQRREWLDYLDRECVLGNRKGIMLPI